MSCLKRTPGTLERDEQRRANSPLTSAEKDFLDYLAEQLVKRWFDEQDEKPAEE